MTAVEERRPSERCLEVFERPHRTVAPERRREVFERPHPIRTHLERHSDCRFRRRGILSRRAVQFIIPSSSRVAHFSFNSTILSIDRNGKSVFAFSVVRIQSHVPCQYSCVSPRDSGRGVPSARAVEALAFFSGSVLRATGLLPGRH